MHKISFYKLSFLIISFGVLFPLGAQTQLTLIDAVNLALENNSEIKRQKIVLDASERAVKYSWNSLLPNVSVSANDTFSSDFVQKQNEVNVSGNVSLNLKADVLNASKKNKIDYEIEKQNYNQLCARIKNNVWNSYLDIINLQQEINYRTKVLKNSEALFAENTYKYKKGFLSENELLTSKVAFEKQKLEVKSKKKELVSLYSEFKLLLGIQNDSQIYLCSNLQSLLNKTKSAFEQTHIEKIKNQIEQENLSNLYLLNLQKKSAEENVKAKKTEIWSPALNFSYSADPDIKEKKINNTFTASVSMSLDSFLPFSAQKEEVRLAEDAVRDLNIQIENQAKEYSIKLNNLLDELKSREESVDAYTSFVEIAQKNYQLCLKNYNSGLLDFQSLKNASTELLETQIEYSNCVAEIIKTYAAIQEISGIEIIID